MRKFATLALAVGICSCAGDATKPLSNDRIATAPSGQEASDRSSRAGQNNTPDENRGFAPPDGSPSSPAPRPAQGVGATASIVLTQEPPPDPTIGQVQRSVMIPEPATLDGWIPELASANPERRALARSVLRTAGTEGLELLVAALHSPNSEIATNAASEIIETLRFYGWTDGTPMFRVVVAGSKGNQQQRDLALRILHAQGRDGLNFLGEMLVMPGVYEASAIDNSSSLAYDTAISSTGISPEEISSMGVNDPRAVLEFAIDAVSTFDSPELQDAYLFLKWRYDLDPAAVLSAPPPPGQEEYLDNLVNSFGIPVDEGARRRGRRRTPKFIERMMGEEGIVGYMRAPDWMPSYLEQAIGQLESRNPSLRATPKPPTHYNPLSPGGWHNAELYELLAQRKQHWPEMNKREAEREFDELLAQKRYDAIPFLLGSNPHALARAYSMPLMRTVNDLNDRFRAAEASGGPTVRPLESAPERAMPGTAVRVMGGIIDVVTGGGLGEAMEEIGDIINSETRDAEVPVGEGPLSDLLKFSAQGPYERRHAASPLQGTLGGYGLFGKSHTFLAYSDDAAQAAALYDQLRLLRLYWEYERDRVRREGDEPTLLAMSGVLHDLEGMMLSLVLKRFADAPPPALPYDPRADILELTMGNKGYVEESLSERSAMLQDVSDPNVRALASDAQAKRDQLTSLEMRQDPASRRELEVARDQLAQSERRLAQASGRFEATQLYAKVIPADVASRLNSDETLVEFIKYRRYNFSGDPWTGDWGQESYAAIVVMAHESAASNVTPHIIPLGDAAIVESAIRDWRESVIPRTDGTLYSEEESRRRGTVLASLVWEPLAAIVGGSTRVFVAAAGELSFVAFEALPANTDEYLVQQFDFAYLPSGRALVRHTADEPKSGAIIVGNPDFAAGGRGPQVPFASLSGAEKEAQSLHSEIQRSSLLIGAEATETTVNRAFSPEILHLATHAFFAPRRADGTRSASGMWRNLSDPNPMRRAGIALSGANAAMAGNIAPGSSDGILTAEEILNMRLSGTRIVAISACESGLGESRGGEGVYGLRRAFAIAGAETLVMSLWSVSDQSTRFIMEDFYQLYVAGHRPTTAMTEVKRNWLRHFGPGTPQHHPFYWAPFTVSG